MAKRAPAALLVRPPDTAEGKACLARRAAEIHAAYVADAVRRMDCPAEQRLALLNAAAAFCGTH